jgi:hypothetical protein
MKEFRKIWYTKEKGDCVQSKIFMEMFYNLLNFLQLNIELIYFERKLKGLSML